MDTTDTTDTTDTAVQPTRDARGRWLPGVRGGGAPPITTETAHEMHAARLAKKRRLIRAALADGVQDAELRRRFGKQAWLAEVAQTQQAISTTPDAGVAATRAAEFLLLHTGLAEPAVGRVAPAPAVPAPGLGDVDIVAVVLRRRLAVGDVVDAVYTDADADV